MNQMHSCKGGNKNYRQSAMIRTKLERANKKSAKMFRLASVLQWYED